jgi:hypothetical protein
MKLTKINKVDISLKQLLDIDTSSDNDELIRVDDVQHNQILVANVYEERMDTFKFRYLDSLFAAGTGITLTNNSGVITIDSTATGSGVSTNSNVLIDCGAFLTPNENVLIDCGTY